LRPLVTSNERCQSKSTQSQSKSPQKPMNNEREARKRYKQEKAITKGILDVRQTQRVLKKRQATK